MNRARPAVLAFLGFLLAVILAACGGGGGGGAPNNPPVADAGANQVVAPGDTVTLDASNCHDPDGQALTYKWEQISGPTVTLSDPNAEIATFVAPDVADAELLVFKMTVSDGIATITDEVTILCKNTAAALPPIADAGADKTVNAGVVVALDGSGSIDPGGGSLTYSWAQTAGAAVTLSSAGTATATFTAPSLPADEVLSFELTVSNGKQSAVDTVNVTVLADPGAHTPKADAGADQTVTSGQLVTLNGSASSDPHNKTLTYSWTLISGPTVTLTGADAAQATFTAPDVTSPELLIFELTVSNGVYANSARTQVTVNPTPDTAAPTIVSKTPDSGATMVDRSVVVTVVFSEAVKASTISNTTFTLAAGSTPVSGTVAYDPATFTATFTPTGQLSASAQYTVNLSGAITDEAGNALAATSWSFTTSTNSKPVARAGADRHVSWGAQVTLDGSASSDAEGPIVGYNWTQIGGTPVTLTGANTAIATFTASSTKVETLTFRLSVTDEDSNVSTDTVMVTVLEDVGHAVFVSSLYGSDSNAGTMASPVKTIGVAVTKAQQTVPRSDVYIAAGSYSSASSISLPDSVSLYGGFSATNWTRSAAMTQISGAATMLRATSILNATVVDGLTISSAPGAAGANSTAVYVRTSGNALKITNNKISAGNGGDTPQGYNGAPGQNGGLGGNGANGANDSQVSRPGGYGGTSACGNLGGGGGGGGIAFADGSDGAKGAGLYGGLGGLGGNAGNPGKSGGYGHPGGSGTAGAGGLGGNGIGTVSMTTHVWVPSNGTSGSRGNHGSGGGGGGGGGGQYGIFVDDGTGAGGGGGGGGACGGYGGQGGYGGGGSFGIFLSASSPVLSGNSITTAGGGRGGNGGLGGTGGTGGASGAGGSCSGGEVGCGGRGGNGGNGGSGGNGGGGGGGVSYGIYRAESSAPSMSGNAFAVGSGGAGGSGASAGATGLSGQLY